MNKGFEPDPMQKSWIAMSREEHERITGLIQRDTLIKAHKPVPNVSLCPECGEALNPVWSYCPWCGQHFEE